MKKFCLQLTLAVITCLCVSACAEDKGNYDYRDLNDLTIDFDDSYSVIARENFTIEPEVTAKSGFNPDLYTYEWKVYDINGTQEPTTLGSELNLSGELILTQGDYKLVLNITEKSTGIYYQKTANLHVDTPLSSGWLLLCNDNGRACLDMVSHIKTPDNIYHDLLKNTDMEDWQEPRQLLCDPKMAEPFYLITGSGTTRLSNSDFIWNPSYMIANEFGTGTFTGSVGCMAAQFPGKVLIDANGRVYYCNTLTGDGLFNTVRSNKFYVSPAVGYNALANQFVPFFLMWDKNNKRFVVCAQEFISIGLNNLSDVAVSDLAGDGFPTVNEDLFKWPGKSDNMSLVHMENTKYDKNMSGNGVTYAILSQGNKRYLYGIILGDLYTFVDTKYGNTYEKAYYVDLSNCTDIASATHFAFSSLKSFMYYSVGGKVYRVNFANGSPSAELQFELPQSEEITCLKFYLWTQDDKNNRTYDLIVGSKDAENMSHLRIYEGFNSEGNFKDAQPEEAYSGFKDIIDVIYRESIVYQQ